MLEMKDISYTYKGKGNRQILKDINMTFEEGKFYVCRHLRIRENNTAFSACRP